MYYDYGDTEYKRTSEVRNLFDLSIDEDYYKPVNTNDAFNGSYTEYESIENKDKTITIEEYFDLIRLYLSDIIKNHNTQAKWEIHLGNTVIDCKTHGEWKNQLTMETNFISFEDSNETHIMHTKSNSIEIMMGNETVEITEEHSESLLQRYQEGVKESMRRSEFVFVK